MTLSAHWNAPKECPTLTDLEFTLKSGENIMISWESATFGKREFYAVGVSTTDSEGKVSTGNLHFLRDNIANLDRIHYLSTSASGHFVKSVTFVDQVPGHYKSEDWTFHNEKHRGEE